MVSSTTIQAQYRLSPYPDLWYNDVDGIRLGLRLLGEVEGTFKDGSHRLDAGLWVGSKLPEHPVSYFLSFTEPIAAISDYGNEGSIQLITSSRTGYALHQLRLNKRWQKEFDELDYFEASVYGSYEKNFNSDFRFAPTSWSSDWKSIVGSTFQFSRASDKGRSNARLIVLREVSEGFNVINFEFKNRIQLSEGLAISSRAFVHKADPNSYGEYLGNVWSSAPIDWLENGFQRAEGTIPSEWINDGLLHVAGGTNLRGYINQFDQYETIYGFNLEFGFNNPIQNRINSSTYFSEILQFKSYLFLDVGGGDNQVIYINPEVNFPDLVLSDTGLLSDAGLGFQLSANIPDYLGKDRGIFIRYDIPLCVSSTVNNESNFKYRNVFGIGAVFNF